MNRVWILLARTKDMLPLLVLAIACALALCSSVFFFNGQRVDESEVVLNAVAIAAGGWDPQWSGYGHLAMYLPASLFAAAAVFLQITGAAASYSDAMYLLFQHDAAFRLTRFLYTLADIGTAMLFAGIIIKVTGQRAVAAMYFVYHLVSPDTWQYANFVRTDTLVSFFTAAAVYALATNRNKTTPVIVGVALGAAIASKYSAAAYVPLIAVLLICGPWRAVAWRERLGMVLTAVIVTAISAVALQPRYNFAGVLSAAATHVSGSQFTQESVSLSDRLLQLGNLATQLEPLAILFVLTMWLALSKYRQSAPVLLAAFLGIAPFLVSNHPRHYWLIPFADALRAAGWLGIACMIELVRTRTSLGVQRGAVALLFAGTVFVAGSRWSDWRDARGNPLVPANAELARGWLYANHANRRPLLYSYEKNYVLPRAYSFADYKSAALFSRVFIFQRNGFQTLHELFKRRLYHKEFGEFTQMSPVPPLLLSVGSGTASRLAGKIKLCAGKKCFEPDVVECSVMLSDAMGRCVTYRWDMDRPQLKADLSRLNLRIDTKISAFVACWYNCPDKERGPLVRREIKGNVKLLNLTGQFFAPAKVAPLDKIRGDAADQAEIILVTSPTAYLPWLKKRQLNRVGESDSEVLSRVMDAVLVQRFDSGSGPIIEVYRHYGIEKLANESSGVSR